jgi:hypothetical protein
MWNIKCMIVLAVIGATGGVTKGVKKNLGATPGKHSITSLQKLYLNITHDTESTAV